MRLIGTPPSHFTRKVRIALLELGLPSGFTTLQCFVGWAPFRELLPNVVFHHNNRRSSTQTHPSSLFEHFSYRKDLK